VTEFRSSLAPYASMAREPDPGAARRLAKQGYHETGMVVIDPSWLPGWVDRQQLIILADKVHGKRPSR
jgi:hypothetical protein